MTSSRFRKSQKETMDEKLTIDKLNGPGNWATWKFQMEHLMRAKGLWTHVSGEAVAPAAGAGNAAQEFERKGERAFSTIVLNIATSQLYLVTSCKSSKEAWDTLKNHFERETLANKLFLKKKYFRCEMAEGTSLETHLKHMKELTDQLAAIDAPIAAEDQVVTLLGSLPPSYSTLVTALEARMDELSLEFVHQSLANEELKRSSESMSGDAAMACFGMFWRKELQVQK